ncbi:MAG: serine/threonine-protein kinase, partial [Thermoanaerobaculia bacterium]|nr:serine/threonine-protein kinase [Thermoanaerobaculia bacterium]
RFEREAKAISQLSHPHICTLHDVGRQDGIDNLVMEYLEGETLADRLGRGTLSVEQALRYGTEIADALGRAHRQGIVHRDLKPGNVMLTKSGVKLLDFGLAKAMETPGPQSGLTSFPTVAGSPALTQEGTILGTFQYMAPEQLEGKETDARTDIFALGCVLYEMATGKPAFAGATQASLISAILRDDPRPISQVEPMSPPALDRIVKSCLAKDPEERWQSSGDVAKELRWVAEGSQTGTGLPAVSIRERGPRAGWVAAGLLALSTVVLAALLLSRKAPDTPAVRASILPPPGSEFVSTALFAGPVEISPDGSRIVFTARTGEGPHLLWLQSLKESAARPLAGTEGAERPFWSPDGRFVGFFTNRALRKIDANGGPVFTLAPVTEGRGGSWNEDGVILFTAAARGPIYRVNAEGGKVEPATVLIPGHVTHRYPHFLPDGKNFFFLARRSGVGAGMIPTAQPAVLVGSLDSKETQVVIEVASNVVYASGYLLYVREEALVAQPFDLGRRAVHGQPVTLAPGVRMDGRFSRGVFSVSRNGVLMYQTGKGHTLSALRWLDRKGAVLGTVGEAAQFFNGGYPEISPDGARATASLVDLRTGASDVWLVDLASGTRNRFTTGPGDKYVPAWSPDGARIAYNISNPAGGGYDIAVKSTSGSGAQELLLSEAVEWQAPNSFSPDGRFLLFQKRKAERDDIWALPLSGDRTPQPIAVSDALEIMGQFSADGRYIAYVSDGSGRDEIYVTAVPGPSDHWQVSQNGGTEPRWRKDGKELFFFAPDNRLMAAEVKSEGRPFEVGALQPLFQARIMGLGYRYDVAKDGQRFLVNSGLPEELSPITLVVNWTAGLPK